MEQSCSPTSLHTKSECTIKDNVLIGDILKEEEHLILNRTILRSFNDNPNFIAMIDAKTGKKVTFAEMKDRSIRCALWLRKQGIEENDVVGISTPNQMSDYVPFLATLYINAIVSPWHYNASQESCEYFFETVSPIVMFAFNESIDKLATIAKNKGIDCKFVAFKKHPEHISLEEILAEQSLDDVDNFQSKEPLDARKKVSQILFTSGTTGTPKAVAHSNHSLLTRAPIEVGMRPGTPCLWYSPLGWTSASWLLLGGIKTGVTRVIAGDFDPEATGKIVEKYKINFMLCLPFFITLCQQANIFTRYDFSSVETICYGGSKQSKSVLEACRKCLPHVQIKSCYGASEGGLLARQTRSSKHVDSAGFVCTGVQLKILDLQSNAVLGPNQEGEIYYKSDYSMLGYLNAPQNTDDFVDQDGWTASGDLGYYDEDGEITVSGRLKQIIRAKSHLLSSYEFEDILMHHSDVKDCAVVAVEHPTENERPFAFVVKACNAKVTADDLIEFVARKNELYRLTGGLVFVDGLPYTPSGKKCTRELQKMAKAYTFATPNEYVYNE